MNGDLEQQLYLFRPSHHQLLPKAFLEEADPEIKTQGGVPVKFVVTTTMAPFAATLSAQKLSRYPPKSAKYLIYLFLPATDRENIAGDLAEEYQTIILPEFGLRRARFWYWKQVICSIWPLIGIRLRRILTIGAIAKAAHEIYKRLGL